MTSCTKEAKQQAVAIAKGTTTIDTATKSIKESTLAAKANKIAMSAMSTALNTGVFMLVTTAVSKLTSIFNELVHSEENLRQFANKLGSELSSNSFDIESYKKKIEELKSVISDSSSSFDEVSQARINLMAIQNELIDKFGTEKGVIESITLAINDQTDALDELSRRKYFQKKTEFNEKTDGDEFADWLSFGNTDDDRIQSNMDKLVYKMENSFYELKTTGNEILDDLIAKSYDLNIVDDMYGNGQHFQIYGTLEEIQNKLYGIQELSQGFDLSTGFENNFTEISNDVDDALVQYKELYKHHILFEKILTNNPNNQYDEQFDLINKAKEAYNEASKLGDPKKIEAASNEYSKTLQSAIDLAMQNNDFDVADYYKSMYPELQQMFAEWQFKLNFKPNTDGLQDRVKTALDGIDGVSDGITSFSVEDIENFNPSVATKEQAKAYGELQYIAKTLYGMTLPQLIAVLQELGLVQSESYQQLVDTFGQDNVNKLSPEDLKIAYTIENAGNMTFKELQAEIQRLKKLDETPTLLSISDTVDQLNTRLKPAMDSLRSAYQNVFTDNEFTPENVGVDMLYSIKEDIDTLNSMEGVNISIDASVFENFARVLNNTSSTADQVKTQFNELANTIVRASGSVAVNTDTFDILASSLEDMGFVNARSVLEEVITAQQAFQEVSEQLGLSLEEVTNATYEETVQMLLAAQASELDTQALWKLAVAQGTINDGTIATETNVDALLAEAKAAGLDAATLTALENVRNGNIKDTNAAQAIMEQAKQSIIASMSDFKLDYDFNPAIKSAGKAGSDTGKSYKEGLKEELSDLDSVISGITKSIDGQIDVIDEQKDTALDAIEAQIDALEEERDARLAVIDAQKAQLEEEIASIDKKIKSKQDEIDAINDAAEARKREIDLQKAQYNLERMQNQRTILQYSQEKGMHYVADEQGIRDAREDVDDARRQIEIADIEKEIDLLENQKDLLNEQIDLLDQQADKINEFYDAQIKTLEKQKEETEKYFESLTKALEDSKSKYTELTEIADKAELSAKLAQLGIDEATLLSGSEEEFQKLKSAYMDTVFQLNEGNTQVLSKLQELSGYSGTAPALLSDSNSALDTMNGKLDLSNQSVGTVNSSLGASAAIAGEIASNVGTLETNLGIVNTFLTDEQTAFSNLKATIDEVITALNLKIQAIQAAQSAAGIATTTEIAYFLLLRDKIDEIKQSIAGINDAITIIDSQPIDHLADSFQRLYEQILLVSTTLGNGMEGQDAGLAGNIISAMQALNKISFEEGIIAQLTNLKTAIDAVTNAISGGGDTSGGETQGGSGATTGGNPGGKDSGGAGSGKSLTGAITDIGTTTSEVIGEPEAEGDGTVIGAFGALETAVDDVTTAIGSGDSEDNEAKGADGEDDNSLIDSITDLGDTTEDILGEPGGDGVIGRFEQFKEPIAAADEHVQSIYKGLTDIDGTEAECTIKVHIETDGGQNFSGSGQISDSMKLESADYTATLNKKTTYDPNQDHSVFGTLYKAWTTHYGSNNQGVETIAKTLSHHLVMEHSQQMAKEITRISNSNNAANSGRDSRPPVTVQIGDIQLTGVQDVNGLAQAIKTRLPGQMMQEYFKN